MGRPGYIQAVPSCPRNDVPTKCWPGPPDGSCIDDWSDGPFTGAIELTNGPVVPRQVPRASEPPSLAVRCHVGPGCDPRRSTQRLNTTVLEESTYYRRPHHRFRLRCFFKTACFPLGRFDYFSRPLCCFGNYCRGICLDLFSPLRFEVFGQRFGSL